MNTPLLQASEIGFSYPTGHVFRGLSFEMSAREILGIIGPNGGGKSTLLRCLAGIQRRNVHGQVQINGVNLADLDRRQVAQKLAYVTQDDPAPFGFTVEEVITMGRHPHRGRFDGLGPRDREAIERALRRSELEDLRARPIGTLSGGERQRVSIARALAQEPEILLLDEPSSHLDLKSRTRLHQILVRLRQEDGLGVLLVTHDLVSAGEICDRLAILANGTLEGPAPPQGILRAEVIGRAFGISVAMAEHPVSGLSFPVPRPGSAS